MNIAYKGTYDFGCRGRKYNVGETYTFEKPIVICEQGFHFCADHNAVFNYYPFTKNFKLLEIEVLGDVQTKDDKSVTNKFKVNGHLILHKMEFKNFKFDENENLTRRTDAQGRVIELKFDGNGNPVHMAHADGYQCWLTYDHNGNVIHRINTDGVEQGFYYDNNGNWLRTVNNTPNKHNWFQASKEFFSCWTPKLSPKLA